MAESFRQGLYMFVAGMLFCISSVVLVILVTGILNLNRNINRANAVAYDNNHRYGVTAE